MHKKVGGGVMLMFSRLIICSVLLCLTPLHARSYVVNNAQSFIKYKASHRLLGASRGVFETFSGIITWPKNTDKPIRMQGKILTSSIETENKTRNKHLKKKKGFFDVDTYPTIVITAVPDPVSSNPEAWLATLQIKGITVTVPMISTCEKKKESVTCTISMSVNRHDLGFRSNKASIRKGVDVSAKIQATI